MDISIIIVSFNTKELLSDCLKSIKSSASSLETETFVVDNNSSDSTVEHVGKTYPWVNLIANKKNLGFSKANNIALRKAKGKYILILNPDTKLMPDTLSTMKQFMDQADMHLGMATCRVELASGVLDRDCRRHFPTPWSSFTHFFGLGKVFPSSKLFNSYYMGYMSQNKEHDIDSCEGAFMFTRAEIFKKIGLFDEEFFFYGEDLDLCYRIKKAGYKIVFTPITKVIHLKGASSGIKKHSAHISKSTKQSRLNSIKESTRAMRLFYKKHYQHKYPLFINWLMQIGILLVERIRIFKSS